MKILLVSKSFTKGGSASGASNLLGALESVGQNVIVCDAYAHPKGVFCNIARFVERVFERVLFDAETHCLRLVRPTYNLCALVARHKPDIVQLCDISGNAIIFSDFKTICCPIIHRMSDFWPYHGSAHYATVPGQGNHVSQWLLYKTIFSGESLPDALVAPSHWLADHLDKRRDKFDSIHVIRNAVKIPETIQVPPSCPGMLRLGFISNSVLDPRKGFCRLIPRLQALCSLGLNVSLHVHGRIAENFKAFLSDFEIVYHGTFGRNELHRVYDSFDILLCPSRLDNSPNVLCEALAHGRPVIGQRETGMESYIDDRTGALIDYWTDSYNMITEFIESCLMISSNYFKFSNSASEFAARQLSPHTIGLAYIELYKKLITLKAQLNTVKNGI